MAPLHSAGARRLCPLGFLLAQPLWLLFPTACSGQYDPQAAARQAQSGKGRGRSSKPAGSAPAGWLEVNAVKHGPKGARRPLVYNHLAKTGGTFVKNVLLGMFGSEFTILEEWQGVKALKLPTEGPDRPFIIGAIRDPCDYYVSLWTFSSGGTVDRVVGSVPGLRRYFGQDRDSGFTSKRDVTNFRRWLRELSSTSLNLLTARFWFSYFKNGNPCRPMFGEVCGGVHSRFESMATEIHKDLASADSLHDIANCWLRTENLESDLEHCLRQYEKEAGITLDWDLFESLKKKKVKNSSKRKGCNEYYDDKSREVVATKDKHIVRLFGYSGCCSGSSNVGPAMEGPHNRTEL